MPPPYLNVLPVMVGVVTGFDERETVRVLKFQLIERDCASLNRMIMSSPAASI
jgi:hypothetical protein